MYAPPQLPTESIRVPIEPIIRQPLVSPSRFPPIAPLIPSPLPRVPIIIPSPYPSPQVPIVPPYPQKYPSQSPQVSPQEHEDWNSQYCWRSLKFVGFGSSSSCPAYPENWDQSAILIALI